MFISTSECNYGSTESKQSSNLEAFLARSLPLILAAIPTLEDIWAAEFVVSCLVHFSDHRYTYKLFT